MKKKIIPILALSTIALAGLAGCNLNGGSVSDYYGVTFINQIATDKNVAAPFTVTALDNNNIVSGNAVKVRKGEALNVKVTFTDADYTDFIDFFKYGTMSVFPNGSIVDSLITEEEPEPIDESNYTLTYDLKNLSEWTLNIPKSVMTQSYKVTFSAHYVDLNEYYDDEALKDLFRPLSDASVLGKSNLLADFTKIDDLEHLNYFSGTPYIHPIKGFTTTLYPNYLLGYTFDESDLANLQVYSVDEKGQVSTEALKKGTDYSVELAGIDAHTSGSRASKGYATKSLKFKFNMTPKQLFKINEKGEIVPRYAGLKTFISNKGEKNEISNNKYVNTYNDPEHPLFHINEASTSLAKVTSFEFNKTYLGDKQYDLAVTFEVKDSTKYRFPTKKDGITSDNLPVEKLSVTSDTNAFGVKFFEDYNAIKAPKDIENEIDIKDAFFGQYEEQYGKHYKDNYGWERLALYDFKSTDLKTFDFVLSDDKNDNTITVIIHLHNFLKNIEYANEVVNYPIEEYLGEGSFNFITSFVLDVEPAAK